MQSIYKLIDRPIKEGDIVVDTKNNFYSVVSLDTDNILLHQLTRGSRIHHITTTKHPLYTNGIINYLVPDINQNPGNIREKDMILFAGPYTTQTLLIESCVSIIKEQVLFGDIVIRTTSSNTVYPNGNPNIRVLSVPLA